MRRVSFAFAFAITALVLGSACSADEARDTAGDVADQAEDAAQEAADEAREAADRAEDVARDAADRAEDVANDRTVNIDDFAYEPKTLTVTRGTEVTWVNQDEAEHTITSDVGDALDSGNLDEGDEFSERFLEDGTFSYHCEVHGKDRMSGKIVVEN